MKESVIEFGLAIKDVLIDMTTGARDIVTNWIHQEPEELHPFLVEDYRTFQMTGRPRKDV